MSTVFMHVGQCGVQIGENMWTNVSKMNDPDTKHVMWVPGGSNTPRALFIDAEKKVITKFASNVKKSKAKLNVKNNSLFAKTGCGSNWAFGKNKLGTTTIGQNLPSFQDSGYTNRPDVDINSSYLDVCHEMIRLKVESCDSFSGFCLTHSLAGGTGSGFGSRLACELYDSYPTAYRLWNVVLPYSTGESPCQNYNQLLSLSTLQQYSDAIVTFDNEYLTDLIFKKNEKVSMDDLNKKISDMMLGCYLPVSSLKSRQSLLSIGNEPWEMIRSVAPVPTLKLLQMRHAAIDSSHMNEKTAWDKLLQKIGTQAKRDTWQDGICHPTLGCVCVCRSYKDSLKRVVDKLESSYKFVKWNPFPVDLWSEPPPSFSRSSSTRLGSKRSVTVCANLSSTATNHVHRILTRAKLMYQHRAYLHWYHKYGVGDDDFERAFTVLENVVLDYREAIK